MENTPLNEAHGLGRQALKLTRKGQLAEAFQCHLKAAGIFQQLNENLAEDSLCKRSIEEQEKFHRRQADIAKALKEFVDKQGAKLRKMSENKSLTYSPADKRRVLQPVVTKRPTDPAIQRRLDEADSLLQMISDRKVPTREPLQKTQSTDENITREFTVRPKNEAEVIEELRTVNINLRELVNELLNELNLSREENRLLKLKLQEHEKRQMSEDRIAAQNVSILQDAPSPQQNAAAMAFHLAYTEQLPVSELPELDPLETPDFDFTSL